MLSSNADGAVTSPEAGGAAHAHRNGTAPQGSAAPLAARSGACRAPVAPVPKDPDRLVERIRNGVIGRNLAVETPFGTRRVTCAGASAGRSAAEVPC